MFATKAVCLSLVALSALLADLTSSRRHHSSPALDAYDSASYAPHLGTQRTSLTILAGSGCPKCYADTGPPLDTDISLSILPSDDPGPGSDPVQTSTPTGVYIEFKMVGSVAPGECESQDPECEDKMCEYDISWMLWSDPESEYQFMLNTFPAGDKKDPDGFLGPGSEYISGWSDIKHTCNESTDYEIHYNFWLPEPNDNWLPERSYTFGCGPCPEPPED